MNKDCINTLPNELIQQIFDNVTDFRADPPSVAKFADEPSPNLTNNAFQPLKHMSSVSRRWRTHLMPELFKYARISLDCPLQWLCVSPGGSVSDFLAFVDANSLQAKIVSLVVYTEQTVSTQRQNIEETRIIRDTVSLWRAIFGCFSPTRLVISAPPSTMAFLASSIEDSDDTWAFEMPFHYLCFSRNGSDSQSMIPGLKSPSFNSSAFISEMQPWTHLAYNEGTMVTGYAHYEWYATLWCCQANTFMPIDQRARVTSRLISNMLIASGIKTIDPPRPIDIFQMLSSSPFIFKISTYFPSLDVMRILLTKTSTLRQWKVPPRVLCHLLRWLIKKETSRTLENSKIESFEYISLFPYSSHVDWIMQDLAKIQALRRVTVKFADTSLLDDAGRLGKGQPDDVWSQWETCYGHVYNSFLKRAKAGTVFVSLDASTERLRDDIIQKFALDELVVGRRVPVLKMEENPLKWIRTDDCE